MSTYMRKFLSRSLIVSAIIVVATVFSNSSAFVDLIEAIFGTNPSPLIPALVWIGFSVAMLTWAIHPLYVSWRQQRKSKLGCLTTFIIASIVSGAISVPTSSIGAETITIAIAQTAPTGTGVSAQAGQPGSDIATNSVAGQPLDIRISVEGDQGLLSTEQQHLLAQEAIGNVGLNGTYHKNVTLLEAMIAMVIIVAVIGGIIYVTIRIIDVIKGIGARRKKQVDGADDDGCTNSTRSVVNRLGLNGSGGDPSNVVYAACFYLTNAFPATMTGDSGYDAVGGFRFTVPIDRRTPTQLCPITLGPLMEADDYLVSRGLSTNMVLGSRSFSSNGVPVTSLTQITYEGDMIGIHMPDMTNLMMRVEWSIDLIEWRPLCRMSMPAGIPTRVNHSQGAQRAFYRLVAE